MHALFLIFSHYRSVFNVNFLTSEPPAAAFDSTLAFPYYRLKGAITTTTATQKLATRCLLLWCPYSGLLVCLVRWVAGSFPLIARGRYCRRTIMTVVSSTTHVPSSIFTHRLWASSASACASCAGSAQVRCATAAAPYSVHTVHYRGSHGTGGSHCDGARGA